MPTHHQFNIQSNQHGIALILSVLILANLLMITFVVTDVVLRIGKTSRQISESEIAYLAAESAIEKAIYEIEKNKNASNLGTPSSAVSGQFSNTQGNWENYIQPVYLMPVTCVDDAQRITFPADPTTQTDKSCLYAADWDQGDFTLAHNNHLTIRLRPGKSFEIDFNISTPSGVNFYPSNFVVSWSPPDPDGKIIVLSATGQITMPTDPNNRNATFPSTPEQLGDSPDYRLRITNTDSTDVTYTINSQSSGEYLPVGIIINSKGYYNVDQKERIIEVERRNWSIY